MRAIPSPPRSGTRSSASSTPGPPPPAAPGPCSPGPPRASPPPTSSTARSASASSRFRPAAALTTNAPTAAGPRPRNGNTSPPPADLPAPNTCPLPPTRNLQPHAARLEPRPQLRARGLRTRPGPPAPRRPAAPSPAAPAARSPPNAPRSPPVNTRTCKHPGPLRPRVFQNNPGSDLLSHGVTPAVPIGGRGLNYRVRYGNGCCPSPMTTGKRKKPNPAHPTGARPPAAPAITAARKDISHFHCQLNTPQTAASRRS